MQVATNRLLVLRSMCVVESAMKNWFGIKQRRKNKTAVILSSPMATVTEPDVLEPISVDAACQTTCPSISIKEEVRKAASALHLCVEESDFDTGTDTDSTIESGNE